jgi:3-oxoacyl-[acyl-carrier-protein] synthase II
MIHDSLFDYSQLTLLHTLERSRFKSAVVCCSCVSYSMRRRVVVTGLGAVTPLGPTFCQTWKRLLLGESGVTTLEQALQCQNLSPDAFDREWKLAVQLPCQVAAPVLALSDSNGSNSTGSSRTTSRFVQLALQAGAEAWEHAGLSSSPYSHSSLKLDETRAGVSMGSGMSSVREVVAAASHASLKRLTPHFVPKVLANSAAGRLSIALNLQGPNYTASSACAAATHAIGDAYRTILFNQADVMLAGGAEAALDVWSLNGFCRLRALSTNHAPDDASRPFDTHRDGFVLGEGAAVLVLEELEHALARKATIYAELTGYGSSGDAHHVTAPDPEGRGAARAMQLAMGSTNDDSRVVDIDYVNAHATSTPMGDEIEARVISRVFQSNPQSNQVLVSSTKGATGHLLGAAGAIEAAFTVMTVHTGWVPPTRNLELSRSHTNDDDNEHPTCFQHVTDTAIHVPTLQAAVSNSFGFGGTNASLVFRKW